nr:STAS domain-containing protein [bacterium]
MQMQQEGERMVITLTGEIDHHAAAYLRGRYQLLMHCQTPRQLIIDMQGVTLMDSSGIGLLIGWYRKLEPVGGKMMLQGVRPQVARVMHISGLDQILDIQEVAG